jgi:hypothetical protein
MDIITLEQVVRKIEGFGQAHLQIKSVGIGSPWQVNADTERIGAQSAYPCLFITPIESSLDDNVITHTVDLMVFDLQDDKQVRSGQIQILSDTNQMLSDIVKSVKSSGDMSLEQQPVRLEAFTERFSDGCAGFACRLNISVPSVLSDCMSPYTL